MPVLTPEKTITQSEPQLAVSNRFAPGRYRFRLSVVDNAGNESTPAELVVSVGEPSRPDPVFDPRIDIRLRDRIIPVTPPPPPATPIITNPLRDRFRPR